MSGNVFITKAGPIATARSGLDSAVSKDSVTYCPASKDSARDKGHARPTTREECAIRPGEANDGGTRWIPEMREDTSLLKELTSLRLHGQNLDCWAEAVEGQVSFLRATAIQWQDGLCYKVSRALMLEGFQKE